jgi:hypothetical protein
MCARTASILLGSLVWAAGLVVPAGAALADELPQPSSIVEIAVRDGAKITAAIYLSQGISSCPQEAEVGQPRSPAVSLHSNQGACLRKAHG